MGARGYVDAGAELLAQLPDLRPHGAAELTHPEQDLYLVGMKSYERAPTFLAMTGYEQVRSVVATLAGDQEAAAAVELTLPETGVCGGSGLVDDPDGTGCGDGACCAPDRRWCRSPGLGSVPDRVVERGRPGGPSVWSQVISAVLAPARS